MLCQRLQQPWERGDGSDFGHVAKALFLPMVLVKALFLAVVLATEAAALYLLLGDRFPGTGP